MAGLLFLLPALLQASTPAPVTPPAQTASAAGDKVICKRQVETGSLASVKKACHTRAEWDAMGRAARDEWKELQGTRGSTHGG